MQKSRFNTAAQGQAQSLLQYPRFLEWMNTRSHDLILADAQLRTPGLGVSAMSVFCANFVAAMIKLDHYNQVVVHFFCQMHTGSREDTWRGPGGLVRSITLQLVMTLMNMEQVNLDFIDNRDGLRAFENHDIDVLCTILWEILAQFPQDITIYCIVDSVSSFDKDSTFGDLSVILEWFQKIVDDRYLAATFKILMTNPTQSTRRMKALLLVQPNQKYASRLINLSSSNRLQTEISDRVIQSHLLRPPTPTPPFTRGDMFGPSFEEDYHSGFDQGWDTE